MKTQTLKKDQNILYGHDMMKTTPIVLKNSLLLLVEFNLLNISFFSILRLLCFVLITMTTSTMRSTGTHTHISSTQKHRHAT
jgi:hypothetical protein